jgi:hypothetical protein
MAKNADNAQQFFNAHAAAQLTILLKFSNKIAENKFTATQWLAKVFNHKYGTDWTDRCPYNHACKKCLQGITP